MKIAQICPRFYPHVGGVETHVYEISARLAKEFEVDVLTTDPSRKLKKEELIKGVRVRRFNSFAPFDAYYFSLELYKYLKRNSSNYDFLHAHSYHAFPALYAAMSKKANKLIFTPHYHGKGHSFFRNLLHKPYKFFGNRIFNNSDAIICVSEYEKSLIINNFNIEEDMIYVIPNGVDLDEFKNVDKIKNSKNHDKKVLLYVGRLEKYKGIDHIVAALSKLSNDFILEIVGNGPYKQNIVRLATRLGVLNRIRFYQDLSKSELIERYAKANVLLLLSRHEAYGLVVAEALAAKTPCIVANESALKEWVDGKSVFGVDYPIDLNALIELIKDVVEKTKFVSSNKLLSWDDVVVEIKRVYRQV